MRDVDDRVAALGQDDAVAERPIAAAVDAGVGPAHVSAQHDQGERPQRGHDRQQRHAPRRTRGRPRALGDPLPLRGRAVGLGDEGGQPGGHDQQDDQHGGPQVRAEDAGVELLRHGEAAQNDLHAQRHDAGQRRQHDPAAVAVAPQRPDHEGQDDEAEDARGEPVRPFEPDVIVALGDDPALAEGPVGARQPGVGDAHGPAQDDQQDQAADGDEAQALITAEGSPATHHGHRSPSRPRPRLGAPRLRGRSRWAARVAGGRAPVNGADNASGRRMRAAHRCVGRSDGWG